MKNTNKSLRRDVYNRLLKDIVSGKIGTGQKLLAAELAEKFNVSRTPIREALLQLEVEGHVILRKNKRALIRSYSKKEVNEYFELIAQLEGFATEAAVDKVNIEEDIPYLQGLLKKMDEFSRIKNYFDYVMVNMNFHKFFLLKHGNDTLTKVATDLRIKMRRVVTSGLSLPLHIENYQNSHRKIVSAVRDGDAKKAGILMKNHVLEAKIYIEQSLLKGKNI